MSRHISESAMKTAAQAQPAPAYMIPEIALSGLTGVAVDEPGCERVGLRGCDAAGLPIVITLPTEMIDATIECLQRVKAIAAQRRAQEDGREIQQMLNVTEMTTFAAAPVDDGSAIDGVLLTFNGGAMDQIVFACPVHAVPPIIEQMHEAWKRQTAARKRIILPS
jgi:hypothetical protein